MSAIWLRLQADLRASWRSWAVLALLIGLAGGAVLTAADGARRTETAYRRLLVASHSVDATVSPRDTGLKGYYQALSRLTGVAEVGVEVGIDAAPLAANGQPQDAVTVASADGLFGYRMERPKLLSGRLPRVDRADEAAITEDVAGRLHVGVGRPMEMVAIANNQSPTDVAHLRHFSVKVVGVVVTLQKVVPSTVLDATPGVILAPAAISQFGPDYHGFDGAFVTLRQGTTVAAFSRQAQEVAASAAYHDQTGGTVLVADQAVLAATVERAIRPQAVALALFSLLAALAAWFTIGQIASRQLALAAGDHPVLRALGMSRVQLTALALVEAGLAATAGAVLAVGAAVVASPLMPIGPARLAEPHPGVEVNAALLGLGFLGIVVLLVARVAWPAWRLAAGPSRPERHGEPAGTARPSRIALAATRAALPASATTGLRMALEPGRGRTAVPVRSAMVGTTVALAAIAAALTFGTNLVHLVHTPALYGQGWDFIVNGEFATLPTNTTSTFVGGQRGVSAWSFGNYGSVTIGGRDIPTVGIGLGRGPLLFPTLLEGRPPAGPNEIVLGTNDLRLTHDRIGQTVAVSVNGRTTAMQIVGRAVFPFFGRGAFTTTDLGEGAAVSPQIFPPLFPGSAPEDVYNFVMVRFSPGRNRLANIRAFQQNLDATGSCTGQNGGCSTATLQRPGDITNYARIQATPLVLAGLLAGLAVATMGQLLVTSVRRRRRDFAVLKTLGFVKGQVSVAVAWQASALAAFSLLAGLPLGVAAGRWSWALLASRLGVAANPQVPLTAVILAAPITLAVANVVAAGPGWVAGRLNPAVVLRAE